MTLHILQFADREFSLGVPDHQVCIITWCQVALLFIQAAQLGRPLA